MENIKDSKGDTLTVGAYVYQKTSTGIRYGRVAELSGPDGKVLVEFSKTIHIKPNKLTIRRD